MDGEEEIKKVSEAEEKDKRTIIKVNPTSTRYDEGMEGANHGTELDDFTSSHRGERERLTSR